MSLWSNIRVAFTDKELWDENLLESYKFFHRKVNELNLPSVTAYKKILGLVKGNADVTSEICRFANQVFPAPYNTMYTEFPHNHITALLKNADVLTGFDEFLSRNGISDFSAFKKELKKTEMQLENMGLTPQELRAEKEILYSSSPIKVEGYNVFFHGTSNDTYKKIMSDGFLEYQKYSPNLEFPFLTQISEFDRNRLYLTDNFDEGLYYALRKTLDGYVIAINLDGITVYNSFISNHHFWTTERLMKDRFMKVYHIMNDNNRIVILDEEVDGH